MHYSWRRWDANKVATRCADPLNRRHKPELVIYAMGGIFEQEPELTVRLGKCKITKACLYVKRLDDIDLKVLKTLLNKSIALTRKTCPQR